MNFLADIEIFYQTAFRQFDEKRDVPPLKIEFYNYIGLRHTIRIRAGVVFVRLSELSKNAAPNVHQALAVILVAKLLKRRVPERAAEIYQNFANQPHVIEQSRETRRQRGRKIISSPRGKFYDLEQIFNSINHDYFQNKLTPPVLSWSQKKTFRIFGHHDALHETIVISKTLDDARIPRFVVEFVMFHELLHVCHPTQIVNNRRQMHTAAFRRDERKFIEFDAAERWLEKLARKEKIISQKAV